MDDSPTHTELADFSLYDASDGDGALLLPLSTDASGATKNNTFVHFSSRWNPAARLGLRAYLHRKSEVSPKLVTALHGFAACLLYLGVSPTPKSSKSLLPL